MREVSVFTRKFLAALRYNLSDLATCIDCQIHAAINAVMQKISHSVSAPHDFDTAKTVVAALATARDWLETGNLAEAAKWAAIAASLGDAENLIVNA